MGFKCFMCPSGVDEFPFVDEDEIKKAVNVLENCDTVLAVSNFLFHSVSSQSFRCNFLVPCRKRRVH